MKKKLFKKTKKGLVLSDTGYESLNKMFELVHDIEVLKEEAEELKKAFNEEMEERGLKEFNYDNYGLTVRKPYTKITKKVDYDFLKKKGLYAKCVTEIKTFVDSSLLLKIHM